ncbi:MAG: hypothetical protein ABGX07_20010 [Pirellulaceae bacterium]|jgi:hypothetical protein|nr:hypothetical protein [Planctomycetaceae bacterium]HIM31072.1 hypothetical protein [Planctomycetota bacterium]
MPDPQKHADKRNWIESIGRFIPGFRGYLEKGYRRESDHLAREWMAECLQRSKTSLDSYMRQMVNAAQLDALPEVQRVHTRLDTLISKIRSQVRGYSGFFDFVRIDVQKLDQVYALDMEMTESVDSLGKAIEALGEKGLDDSPAAVTADLIRRIDDAETQLERRSDLLKGVGE